MSAPITVGVRILGNEYPIRCQEGQVEDLKASAHSLDERLQRMRADGATDTLDRLAVTAALNLAYDCLLAQRRLDAAAQGSRALDERIRALNERLDHAIRAHRPDADVIESPALEESSRA